MIADIFVMAFLSSSAAALAEVIACSPDPMADSVLVDDAVDLFGIASVKAMLLWPSSWQPSHSRSFIMLIP